MKSLAFVCSAAVLTLLAARPAAAADQAIGGRQIIIKDGRPGVDPGRRRLVGEGKEINSPNTVVGDPTVSGATVTFSGMGATPSTQAFTLATGIDPARGQPFWSPIAGGFKYRDQNGANGAVTTANIQKSSSGKFLIKVVAVGSKGPITVVPPAPGTESSMVFDVPGGDTYHVLMVPGSIVKRNDAIQFSLRDGPAYRFVTQWSTSPNPKGVALDGSGNVYVNVGGIVDKYDGNGTFLATYGTNIGTETGGAGGIAVDASGNMYVRDFDRVKKLDATGALVTSWVVGDGALALDLDASANVYLTQPDSNRVQKFNTNGTPITDWTGDFFDLRGLAVDASGNVYVCDGANGRIQKYNGTGTFLGTIGTQGKLEGQIAVPVAVAVDAAGTVYVSDSKSLPPQNTSRISTFAAGGTFLKTWGSFGAAPGQFASPVDLAVDASGNVHVADRGQSRIQKFAPCALCR